MAVMRNGGSASHYGPATPPTQRNTSTVEEPHSFPRLLEDKEMIGILMDHAEQSPSNAQADLFSNQEDVMEQRVNTLNGEDISNPEERVPLSVPRLVRCNKIPPSYTGEKSRDICPMMADF
ncbi:hypothetical protein EYF80_027105 [Liparis tanakae]|uniref:Uncharacterized protein n=1 Tax=Liparis tanakae TaxID=230148 RepID=A0A4Z2HCP4_9TELE|nr:hypothetical protein EYF80_027105 [Liparis tanakae]